MSSIVPCGLDPGHVTHLLPRSSGETLPSLTGSCQRSWRELTSVGCEILALGSRLNQTWADHKGRFWRV
uniref:Uncharacterized protein n=1 Tax=Physcomitrium patens TaxID=3218 RepID=A0A7I3ZVW9_PHYPA